MRKVKLVDVVVSEVMATSDMIKYQQILDFPRPNARLEDGTFLILPHDTKEIKTEYLPISIFGIPREEGVGYEETYIAWTPLVEKSIKLPFSAMQKRIEILEGRVKDAKTEERRTRGWADETFRKYQQCGATLLRYQHMEVCFWKRLKFLFTKRV